MDNPYPCACLPWHSAYRVGGARCACKCHGTLTEDEQADLAAIAVRAEQDRGDIQPMLWQGKVMPWRLAIELEVA